MQPGSLTEIAKKSGLSNDVGKAVASAISGVTIRAGLIENLEFFSTALAAELEYVAKTYTGGVNTHEMVWDEAMDFIVSQYGNLNIKEILYAFRLAASGELGDVNLRSYYGTFTVGMLGEVLTAYMDRRQQLYFELLRLESEQLMVEVGGTGPRHDVDEWKRNRLTFLKMLDSPTVEDVTSYDYRFISELGLIDLTKDEKLLIMDRAYPILVREILQDASALNSFRSKQLRDMVTQANSGNPSPVFVARHKAMGERLAVVEWLKSLRSDHK